MIKPTMKIIRKGFVLPLVTAVDLAFFAAFLPLLSLLPFLQFLTFSTFCGNEGHLSANVCHRSAQCRCCSNYKSHSSIVQSQLWFLVVQNFLAVVDVILEYFKVQLYFKMSAKMLKGVHLWVSLCINQWEIVAAPAANTSRYLWKQAKLADLYSSLNVISMGKLMHVFICTKSIH